MELAYESTTENDRAEGWLRDIGQGAIADHTVVVCSLLL